MKLEEEYLTLSSKESLSKFEQDLLNHLHDRCNRLWKKIGNSTRPGPDTIKFYERS